MNELHFYFDMDGVLAIFEEDVPKNIVLSDTSHYFRTCPPDPVAIETMRELTKVENAHITILTRLFPNQTPVSKAIQEADKLAWCQEHIDFLKLPEQFKCIADDSKSKLLQLVPIKQRAFHILIDDDPEILTDWKNNFGTGIQYLQPGRSVKEWSGGVLKSDGTKILPVI